MRRLRSAAIVVAVLLVVVVTSSANSHHGGDRDAVSIVADHTDGVIFCGSSLVVVSEASPFSEKHWPYVESTLVLRGGSSGGDHVTTEPCLNLDRNATHDIVRCRLREVSSQPTSRALPSMLNGAFRVTLVQVAQRRSDGGTPPPLPPPPQQRSLARPIHVACWHLGALVRDSGELLNVGSTPTPTLDEDLPHSAYRQSVLLPSGVPVFGAEVGGDDFHVVVRDGAADDDDIGSRRHRQDDEGDSLYAVRRSVTVIIANAGHAAPCTSVGKIPFYSGAAYRCRVVGAGRQWLVLAGRAAQSAARGDASLLGRSDVQPLAALDARGPVAAATINVRAADDVAHTVSVDLSVTVFRGLESSTADAEGTGIMIAIMADGVNPAPTVAAHRHDDEDDGAATSSCEGLMLASVTATAADPTDTPAGAVVVVNATVRLDTTQLSRSNIGGAHAVCARLVDAVGVRFVRVGSVAITGPFVASVAPISRPHRRLAGRDFGVIRTVDRVSVGLKGFLLARAFDRMEARLVVVAERGSTMIAGPWTPVDFVGDASKASAAVASDVALPATADAGTKLTEGSPVLVEVRATRRHILDRDGTLRPRAEVGLVGMAVPLRLAGPARLRVRRSSTTNLLLTGPPFTPDGARAMAEPLLEDPTTIELRPQRRERCPVHALPQLLLLHPVDAAEMIGWSLPSPRQHQDQPRDAVSTSVTAALLTLPVATYPDATALAFDLIRSGVAAGVASAADVTSGNLRPIAGWLRGRAVAIPTRRASSAAEPSAKQAAAEERRDAVAAALRRHPESVVVLRPLTVFGSDRSCSVGLFDITPAASAANADRSSPIRRGGGGGDAAPCPQGVLCLLGPTGDLVVTAAQASSTAPRAPVVVVNHTGRPGQRAMAPAAPPVVDVAAGTVLSVRLHGLGLSSRGFASGASSVRLRRRGDVAAGAASKPPCTVDEDQSSFSMRAGVLTATLLCFGEGSTGESWDVVYTADLPGAEWPLFAVAIGKVESSNPEQQPSASSSWSVEVAPVHGGTTGLVVLEDHRVSLRGVPCARNGAQATYTAVVAGAEYSDSLVIPACTAAEEEAGGRGAAAADFASVLPLNHGGHHVLTVKLALNDGAGELSRPPQESKRSVTLFVEGVTWPPAERNGHAPELRVVQRAHIQSRALAMRVAGRRRGGPSSPVRVQDATPWAILACRRSSDPQTTADPPHPRAGLPTDCVTVATSINDLPTFNESCDTSGRCIAHADLFAPASARLISGLGIGTWDVVTRGRPVATSAALHVATLRVFAPRFTLHVDTKPASLPVSAGPASMQITSHINLAGGGGTTLPSFGAFLAGGRHTLSVIRGGGGGDDAAHDAPVVVTVRLVEPVPVNRSENGHPSWELPSGDVCTSPKDDSGRGFPMVTVPVIPLVGSTVSHRNAPTTALPFAPAGRTGSAFVFCVREKDDTVNGPSPQPVATAWAVGFSGSAELLPRAEVSPSSILVPQATSAATTHALEHCHPVRVAGETPHAAAEGLPPFHAGAMAAVQSRFDLCRVAVALVPCGPSRIGAVDIEPQFEATSSRVNSVNAEGTVAAAAESAAAIAWAHVYGEEAAPLSRGETLVTLRDGAYQHSGGFYAVAVRVPYAASDEGRTSRRRRHAYANLTSCARVFGAGPRIRSVQRLAKAEEALGPNTLVSAHPQRGSTRSGSHLLGVGASAPLRVRVSFSEPVHASRGIEVRWFERGPGALTGSVLRELSTTGGGLSARHGWLVDPIEQRPADASVSVEDVVVGIPGPGVIVLVTGTAGGRPAESISVATVVGVAGVWHDPLLRTFHVAVAATAATSLKLNAAHLAQFPGSCSEPPLDAQPTTMQTGHRHVKVLAWALEEREIIGYAARPLSVFAPLGKGNGRPPIDKGAWPWVVIQIRFHQSPHTGIDAGLCLSWARGRTSRKKQRAATATAVVASALTEDAMQAQSGFRLTAHVDLKSTSMEKLGTRGFFTFSTNVGDSDNSAGGVGAITVGAAVNAAVSQPAPRALTTLPWAWGNVNEMTAHAVTAPVASAHCHPMSTRATTRALPILKPASKHAIHAAQNGTGAAATWVFVATTPGIFCLHFSRFGAAINAGFVTVPGPLHAMPAAAGTEIDAATGAAVATCCDRSSNAVTRAAAVPPPHGASALTRNWAHDMVLFQVGAGATRAEASKCDGAVVSPSVARVRDVTVEQAGDIDAQQHLRGGAGPGLQSVRIRATADVPGLYSVCLQRPWSRALAKTLRDVSQDGTSSPSPSAVDIDALMRPPPKFFGLARFHQAPELAATLRAIKAVTLSHDPRDPMHLLLVLPPAPPSIPQRLLRLSEGRSPKDTEASGVVSRSICGVEQIDLRGHHHSQHQPAAAAPMAAGFRRLVASTEGMAEGWLVPTGARQDGAFRLQVPHGSAGGVTARDVFQSACVDGASAVEDLEVAVRLFGGGGPSPADASQRHSPAGRDDLQTTVVRIAVTCPTATPAHDAADDDGRGEIDVPLDHTSSPTAGHVVGRAVSPDAARDDSIERCSQSDRSTSAAEPAGGHLASDVVDSVVAVAGGGLLGAIATVVFWRRRRVDDAFDSDGSAGRGGKGQARSVARRVAPDATPKPESPSPKQVREPVPPPAKPRKSVLANTAKPKRTKTTKRPPMPPGVDDAHQASIRSGSSVAASLAADVAASSNASEPHSSRPASRPTTPSAALRVGAAMLAVSAGGDFGSECGDDAVGPAVALTEATPTRRNPPRRRATAAARQEIAARMAAVKPGDSPSPGAGAGDGSHHHAVPQPTAGGYLSGLSSADDDSEGGAFGRAADAEPRELSSETDVAALVYNRARGPRDGAGTETEGLTSAPDAVLVRPRRVVFADHPASSAATGAASSGSPSGKSGEDLQLQMCTVALVDLARGKEELPMPALDGDAGGLVDARQLASRLASSFADGLFDLLHSDLPGMILRGDEKLLRNESGVLTAPRRPLGPSAPPMQETCAGLTEVLERIRVGVLVAPSRPGAARVAWYLRAPSVNLGLCADSGVDWAATSHAEQRDLVRLQVSKKPKPGAAGTPSELASRMNWGQRQPKAGELGWDAARDAARAKRCASCEVFLAVTSCCGAAMPHALWGLKPVLRRMWLDVLLPLPSWLESVASLGIFADAAWGTPGHPTLSSFARLSHGARADLEASDLLGGSTSLRSSMHHQHKPAGGEAASADDVADGFARDLLALADAGRRRFEFLHQMAASA